MPTYRDSGVLCPSCPLQLKRRARIRCEADVYYPGTMTERPHPVFRTSENVLLIGTMAIYDSQAEASQLIPHQWREFRQAHPALGSSSKFYGASPCTGDRKIHYLTGVDQESLESSIGGERLTLEAGEYAVLQVGDPALRKQQSETHRSERLHGIIVHQTLRSSGSAAEGADLIRTGPKKTHFRDALYTVPDCLHFGSTGHVRALLPCLECKVEL